MSNEIKRVEAEVICRFECPDCGDDFQTDHMPEVDMQCGRCKCVFEVVSP